VRESLSSLSSYLASLASTEQRATTLYAVETLGLLGVTDANTPLEQIVSARMHAHPFTEPLTQLDYVRARWYDARAGSFLTPDPLGYNDSSNLYAFASGDPVNGRDPTGEQALPQSTPTVPLPAGPGGKVIPFRAAGPRVGAAGVVALALAGYDALNTFAAGLESKADEYVEEQLQEQNRIKVAAAKRRNGGTVLPRSIKPDNPYSNIVAATDPNSDLAPSLENLEKTHEQNKQTPRTRARKRPEIDWVVSPYQSPYDPLHPGRPDPNWSIDTRAFSGADTTANGGIRNKDEFWALWIALHPETISLGNKWKIENGYAPEVDDVWTNAFPQHKPFKGDKLHHHHVDQGPFAIPVPASTHPGSGGPLHGHPLRNP
jgi:RHS repeat-associated protein